METQFLHRVCLVHFDGLDAQVQLPGDVFVAMSLSHQSQDFELAVAQSTERFGPAPGAPSDGAAEEARADAVARRDQAMGE